MPAKAAAPKATVLTSKAEEELRGALNALGSDDFEEREEASRKLKEMGTEVHAKLKASLEAAKDPEVRSRLLSILNPRPVGSVKTTVLVAHDGWVVLETGSTENVKVGDRFAIRREESSVGAVTVHRVSEELALAVVLAGEPAHGDQAVSQK